RSTNASACARLSSAMKSQISAMSSLARGRCSTCGMSSLACLGGTLGASFTLDTLWVPRYGRAAVQTLADVLPQLLELGLAQAISLFHQTQRLTHDLAGRRVQAGVDLVPHHFLQLRREIDVHAHGKSSLARAPILSSYVKP